MSRKPARAQAREADQVAALLRLLALRVEPEGDLRAAGDVLADGVQVLIPRDLLAGHDQLAGVGPEEVVALADGPLHQLRTAVDQVLARERARRTVGRARVHGIGVVVEHQVRDRVVEDLAALQVRGTNLDHLHPAGLGDRDVAHRPEPDVLVHGGHRVIGRLDHQVGLAETVHHALPHVLGEQLLGRGQVARVALGRAGVHPADDGLDLLRPTSDMSFLNSLDAHRRVDVPRRHLPAHHAVLDGPGPRPRLLVADERHRRDGVRLMARLASGLEDGRDVLGEGHRRVRSGPRDGRGSHHCPDCDQPRPQSPHEFTACHVRLLGLIRIVWAGILA